MQDLETALAELQAADKEEEEEEEEEEKVVVPPAPLNPPPTKEPEHHHQPRVDRVPDNRLVLIHKQKHKNLLKKHCSLM